MRYPLPLPLLAAALLALPAAAQETSDSTHAVHAAEAAHGGHAEPAHPAAAAHAAPHHPAPIAPSRPGLAEHTGVVERGRLQFEGGYSLARLEGENHHRVGEGRVRLGVGGHTELRLDLNSFAVATHHGHELRGYEDAELGVKRELARSDSPWLPSAAVMLSTTLPTGSGDFASGAWQPTGALSLGWQLPEHLSVVSTVQYARLDDHGEPVGHLTGAVSAGLPAWGNLHSHVEYALILPTAELHERIHHFSGGYGLHLGHDAQLDLWGGAALIHGETELLLGAGVSRRW